MHKDNWKSKELKNRSQDLRKVLVSSLGQLNLLRLHNRHQLFFLLKGNASWKEASSSFLPLRVLEISSFALKKNSACYEG